MSIKNNNKCICLDFLVPALNTYEEYYIAFSNLNYKNKIIAHYFDNFCKNLGFKIISKKIVPMYYSFE